jgi:glucose-6-phosphate isomerase
MLSVDLSGFSDFRRKDIPVGNLPFFHNLKPDFTEIRSLAQKFARFRRIVILGNGGAVNAFVALHHALYKGNKQVTVVNSMEPDLLDDIKKANPRKDTLVIVSSTSGTNVGCLEMMSQFSDYHMVVITAENEGALRQIAARQKLPMLFVPHFVDRFQAGSGLTYFPLALLGIDIERLDLSLHLAYDDYMRGNEAKDCASALYQLEQKGYTDVFVPIYGFRLEGFALYITQLMHESVCKDGKGQTFLVVSAPESEHHTNQRLFGGRKNMCALFHRVIEQNDSTVTAAFDTKISDIKLREGTLASINDNPLAKSFEYEFSGTYQDALTNKIPVAIVNVERTDEEHVTRLIAFWHYVAVYSSLLRKVNPFDQPQVEKSKEIAFRLRAEHSGV